MNATPSHWPRITAGLYYRDAPAALEWLCRVFGFSIRLRIEDGQGRLVHSELEYGDGLIMVGQEETEGSPSRFPSRRLSPLSANGHTQSLMVYIEDVDSHYDQARAAGAQVVAEPQVHDYGQAHWTDKSYGVLDPEGHLWWFCERLRTSDRNTPSTTHTGP